MSFLDAIKSTLEEEYNFSQTENGAIGFQTTGKALLDINFHISSFRRASKAEIIKEFSKAYYENKILTILWLFYVGDVRGGVGERRLFKVCFDFLQGIEPELCKELLPLIPEYTRWDNLLILLDTNLRKDVCELFDKQLAEDEENMAANKPISLCAKWMPSITTTCDMSRVQARIIADEWGVSAKMYRKRLSALREYLNVAEVYMSRGDWGLINYEQVPSRANLNYSEAFLRNDEERREAYLKALSKGEVKINSSVLYPHDIVHKYNYRGGTFYTFVKCPENATLEALWANLPDYVKGKGEVICVCDTSGSMFTTVGNTAITAFDVSMGLSLYFAERAGGEYKDKFITFSRHPKMIDLSNGKSLIDRIGILMSHMEVANTNIEGVFDLILKSAIRSHSAPEDLPKTILILSDMEFDECADYGNCASESVLFKVIQKRYAKYGYKVPRLAFWNITSRSKTIPVLSNENGIVLVSGFSPQVLEMVLSNELDPYKCLLDQITKDRYKPVYDIISNKLK